MNPAVRPRSSGSADNCGESSRQSISIRIARSRTSGGEPPAVVTWIHPLRLGASKKPGAVHVEIRGGLGDGYVSLRFSDADWVLRFGRDDEAAEFARLVTI